MANALPLDRMAPSPIGTAAKMHAWHGSGGGLWGMKVVGVDGSSKEQECCQHRPYAPRRLDKCRV